MTRPIQRRIRALRISATTWRLRGAHAPGARLMAVIKANALRARPAARGAGRCATPTAWPCSISTPRCACAARATAGAFCCWRASSSCPSCRVWRSIAWLPWCTARSSCACSKRCRSAAPVDVFLKLNTGMNRLGLRPRSCARRSRALQACRNVGRDHADDALRLRRRRARDRLAARTLRGAPRRAWDCRSRSPTPPRCCATRTPRADWVRAGHHAVRRVSLRRRDCGAARAAAGHDAGEPPDRRAGAVARRCGRLRRHLLRHPARCASASSPAATPTATRATPRPARRCWWTDKRTRTLGRVSMDMLCVDLTDLPEARCGQPGRAVGRRAAGRRGGGRRRHDQLRAAVRAGSARACGRNRVRLNRRPQRTQRNAERSDEEASRR